MSNWDKAGLPKQCPHGISFDAECRECKLVWYRDCLADALRRVQSCVEQICNLTAGGGER